MSGIQSPRMKIAIVGLPNVGKSTLFNALLKKQSALAANYPFATIEPNIGVVEVPDSRLMSLAEVIAAQNSTNQASNGKENSKGILNQAQNDDNSAPTLNLPPLVPATIQFVDIAGLVEGASKGEGLGNQFLANIRECDLVCHVLRSFEDSDVVLTGKMDPLEDLKTVRLELILKDMESVESKQKDLERKSRGGDKLAKSQLEVLQKLVEGLGQEKTARDILSTSEQRLIKEWWLLTVKPEIFIINVDENELQDTSEKKQEFSQKLAINQTDIVCISAKIESELAVMSDEEQQLFMEDLGIKESGIDRLAQVAYQKLGLISFLTAGEIECRAWTCKKGSTAVEAAGVIHTDFMQKFIKAKVCAYNDFIEHGGWKKAAELGKVRLEGRDYIMNDGDVVEFMIGS